MKEIKRIKNQRAVRIDKEGKLIIGIWVSVKDRTPNEKSAYVTINSAGDYVIYQYHPEVGFDEAILYWLDDNKILTDG